MNAIWGSNFHVIKFHLNNSKSFLRLCSSQTPRSTTLEAWQNFMTRANKFPFRRWNLSRIFLFAYLLIIPRKSIKQSNIIDMLCSVYDRRAYDLTNCVWLRISSSWGGVWEFSQSFHTLPRVVTAATHKNHSTSFTLDPYMIFSTLHIRHVKKFNLPILFDKLTTSWYSSSIDLETFRRRSYLTIFSTSCRWRNASATNFYLTAAPDRLLSWFLPNLSKN